MIIVNRGSKSAIAIVSGALLGVVLVVAAGIIALHRDALVFGLTLNPLASEVGEVTEPAKPIVAALSLGAVVAVATLIPIWISLRRTRATANAFTWSFSVVALALAVFGLTGETNPLALIAAGMLEAMPDTNLFEHWLGAGGVEPAVYAAALTALGALAFTRRAAAARAARLSPEQVAAAAE